MRRMEREEKTAESRERVRAADRALEERRMKMELRKLELSRLELSRAEPQRQAGTNRSFGLDGWTAGGPPRQETLAGRTKIFGDAMRHVLPQMPSESAEMPQFFETIEKLFEMYDVPDDIKSKLLIPALTAQAKALVNRMSVECMGKSSIVSCLPNTD